jgi:hypothetical protein
MDSTESSGGWFKSSYSSGNGACLEIRHTADGIEVRDTKDPGPVQRYTRKEWTAFLAGAKDGEFDLPT